MAQLSLDQKREIAARLGYRLVERDNGDKRELFGPDGRHRAIFRPSKAMDVWIWNDAVFNFELYQDQDGVVHRLISTAGDTPTLQAIWPAAGEAKTLTRAELSQGFERLSGGQTV